ncbi:hypothetical protein [Leptolyngbya sp. Heron Island J]|uniref:hypothetical protein n=1 Tax=Leptolyngbya sp. Heron Island J TaxID=1385935 RepID=UPI001F405583|nr:hypothetical protein [Leptolyngbya sp. Heron Island J]
MLLDITQGAAASVFGNTPLPEHQYETVRHLVFGSLTGVRLTSKTCTKDTMLSPTTGVNPSPPDAPMK